MSRKDGAYKINYSKLIDVKQVKIKYNVIAILKYIDGNIKEASGFKTDVSRYGSITDESIFCSEASKLSCNFFCDSHDVLQALEPFVIIMFHRIKVDMYKDNLKALASKRCGTSWALFSGDVEADFNCLSSSVNKTIILSDNEKNRISDLRRWLTMHKDTMICSENPYYEAALSQVRPGLIFRLPCLILKVEKDEARGVCCLYVVDGSAPKESMETFELSLDAISKITKTSNIVKVIDSTNKVFNPNSLAGQFKYLVLHAFEENFKINEVNGTRLKLKLINEMMDLNESQLSLLKYRLHYIDNSPTTSSDQHVNEPNTEKFKNEIIRDNPFDIRNENLSKDISRYEHRIEEIMGQPISKISSIKNNDFNNKENLPKQVKSNNNDIINQNEVELRVNRLNTRNYMNYLASYDYNNAPLTENSLNLFTYTQSEADESVTEDETNKNNQFPNTTSPNNESNGKILFESFMNDSFTEDNVRFTKLKKTLEENLVKDIDKVFFSNKRFSTSTQQNPDSVSPSHPRTPFNHLFVDHSCDNQKMTFSNKAACTFPKEGFNDDIFRRFPTKRQKNEIDFLFDHRRIPKTFTSDECLGASFSKVKRILKYPYTANFKIKGLFVDYEPKVQKGRYPYIVWRCSECSFISPLDDINEMRLSREIDKWILSQYEYKNNLLCPKCQNIFELAYNFEVILMDLKDNDKENDTDTNVLRAVLTKKHAINFLGGIKPIDVLSYKKSFEKLKKRFESLQSRVVICNICSFDEHDKVYADDGETAYLSNDANNGHEISNIEKTKNVPKNRKYMIFDTFLISK